MPTTPLAEWKVGKKRRWPSTSNSSLSLLSKMPLLKKQRRDACLRIDFTSQLFSDELVLGTFAYLSAHDLIECGKVNHAWSRLSRDAEVSEIRVTNRYELITFCSYGGPYTKKDSTNHFAPSKRNGIPWLNTSFPSRTGKISIAFIKTGWQVNGKSYTAQDTKDFFCC